MLNCTFLRLDNVLQVEVRRGLIIFRLTDLWPHYFAVLDNCSPEPGWFSVSFHGNRDMFVRCSIKG